MAEIHPLTMPKWGLAMTEGMVAAWHVEEGADIKAGDEIMDIETSKITNVYESPVAGTLRRRIVVDDRAVPVGALLGVVAEGAVEDAEIEAFVTRFEEEFAAHAAEAEAEEALEPESVEVAGRALRYLKMGEAGGVPILLIHGFGGDLNTWMFNQPGLAETHTTYAVELPGHGGSSKQVGDGGFQGMAEAMLGFLDAMRIERAHLVGHSLGGAIGFQLAIQHPDRVASVTGICPAGLGPDINMDYVTGFVAAGRRKQMKPVLELLVHDPALVTRDMIEEVLKYKRLDGVTQALDAMAGAIFAGGRQAMDLASDLTRATAPIQVIWGADDQIVPADHAENRPDGIDLHLLPETGHLAHMERASEVTKLMGDFGGD